MLPPVSRGRRREEQGALGIWESLPLSPCSVHRGPRLGPLPSAVASLSPQRIRGRAHAAPLLRDAVSRKGGPCAPRRSRLPAPVPGVQMCGRETRPFPARRGRGGGGLAAPAKTDRLHFTAPRRDSLRALPAPRPSPRALLRGSAGLRAERRIHGSRCARTGAQGSDTLSVALALASSLAPGFRAGGSFPTLPAGAAEVCLDGLPVLGTKQWPITPSPASWVSGSSPSLGFGGGGAPWSRATAIFTRPERSGTNRPGQVLEHLCLGVASCGRRQRQRSAPTPPSGSS